MVAASDGLNTIHIRWRKNIHIEATEEALNCKFFIKLQVL